MRIRHLVALLLVLAVVGVGLTFLQARPLKPTDAPPASSFAPEAVRRGAELAAIGDCASCHTAPNGRPYAGGVALETPYGTIHGTNVTPDPDTGIGRWSAQAFARAMREGVDREGRRLYPAFPYSHYTRLAGGDIDALYAFLMTRTPVRATAPENRLRFPYGFRPIVIGWNWLYLDRKRFRPDPTKSDQWNHGAYLAEALGHCGACHTPRTRFGGEDPRAHFNGGVAEGWWAPPLNQTSPSAEPWTADGLYAYLRSWDAAHGGAVGPMAAVTANLAGAPEADVRAIAAYVAERMGPPQPLNKARRDGLMARAEPDGSRDPALARGGAVYQGACAQCHATGGQTPFTVPSLAQHTSLFGPVPDNVLQVVLHGIRTPQGAAGPLMPGFADALTPAQVADLAAYLRARFTDQPPWPDVEAAVRRIRGQPSQAVPAAPVDGAVQKALD
ncbi:c-type cytochrome [Alsobacter sp. KACC 23698]|uniref:C-type cytochrome n=1 Tax=Alsobacter sp. KACC 23698 TaxID=3149229 RepID=A0AAU7J995_9HYPH